MLDIENIPPVAKAFSKEEEERKREEYLMCHPTLRWRAIMSAIDWVEANKPAHLRRNRPRQPNVSHKGTKTQRREE